ncbi:MAG: DUF1273 family protein [Clostridia bacterium]|nr:DUF1273 family protein [Clostridia bacterium]
MKAKTYSCCFTGYRPYKFPFSFQPNDADYLEMENRLTDAIFSLPKRGCVRFYSGAAMGFDLLAAETVLLYQQAVGKGVVELICAIPFPEQANGYPEEWKERYERVLAAADRVVTVSPVYTRNCYQARNQYMVDHSDLVITWYDGQTGGTRNTLLYAKQQDKHILNLYKKPLHQYSGHEGYLVVNMPSEE